MGTLTHTHAHTFEAQIYGEKKKFFQFQSLSFLNHFYFRVALHFVFKFHLPLLESGLCFPRMPFPRYLLLHEQNAAASSATTLAT